MLYKNKVIVIQDQNNADSVCIAFEKETGAEVWRQKRDQAMCWSTPVVLRVDDHDELVYNGSHKVIGYDPDTGNPLWWVNGTSSEAVPMVVVGGGLIYSMSGRNGPMLAIRPGGKDDATATHIAWKLARGGPHVPSPAYYEGRLYLVNDTGIASCLNASTGETVWQTRLRGRFSMSPVEAGGKLLFTNEAGTTSIIAAEPEYKLLATNDLQEDVLATPALVEGRLYFRTKGRLICIGEAGTAAARSP